MPFHYRNRIAIFLFIVLFASCKKDDNFSTYDIVAASTSFEDVQAAVDSAESGDRVLIPAGTSTWLTTLEITDNRRITLSGSGRDETIISSVSNMPGIVINVKN